MPTAVDGDALLAFAQALVRIPSVHRPQDGLSEAPAAALVAGQMREFGWAPVVEEAAPRRPNVIAVIDAGIPGPTLMFEGHTDVVTEGDPAAWTHGPFSGEVAGGRLYGRGSADMKAGVAAMLFGAAAATGDGDLPGRVVVAALADEEGMMLGVRDFLRRGHGRTVDAAIVCEPEDGEVCIAQKGALRARVLSRGRMAHGAMPAHGRNPIPPLAEFVGRCGELEAALQAANGEDRFLGWDHVTVTALGGGSEQQLNVIPDHAWALLDIRTTPLTDHSDLIARLQGLLGPEMELEVIDDRPATRTPEDHPVVRAVFEAHQAVYGERPRLGGVPGSTDGTMLWREGIPIVTYGPGGKWIAHQVDEYVEVADLVRSAEVYAEAARRFLSRGMESSRSRV